MYICAYIHLYMHINIYTVALEFTEDLEVQFYNNVLALEFIFFSSMKFLYCFFL